MNKFYAFFALAFLTACGSSDNTSDLVVDKETVVEETVESALDGNWSDPTDADARIEISGDIATLIDGDMSLKCVVSEPQVHDNNETYLIKDCDDAVGLEVVIAIVDGNLQATIAGVGESTTFVRN